MARSFSQAATPVVKPLRYRIDPSAEQQDVLDGLHRELDAIRHNISPDDYADMVAILKGRQAALAKRVARLADPHRVHTIELVDVPTPDKLAHLTNDCRALYRWCVTCVSYVIAFLKCLKNI